MRVLNLFLVALSGTILCAAPSYQIFGLGNLGGAAAATGISNNGVIVGSSATATGDYRGFVWNGGGLIELAGLPNTMQQYATGVNNAGTITGSADGAAVRWQNGTPGAVGQGEGSAMAINDAGQVAGMQNGKAFRTVNGQVEYLGTLAGGNWASAYGINASGDVAGYGDTANGSMRGFVSSNGQLQQIGTLGGNSSYAMALNNAGQAVGHSARSNGYLEAFLYYNGVMTGLGTLGGASSTAYGINGSGSVVGSSWVAGDGTTAAFVYRNGQMLNLNDLVAPNSGWQLLAAYGINDSGQIVGAGLYNGEQMAVLLNPLAPPPLVSGFDPAAVSNVPEPGTVGLMVAGLACIAFGRFRSRAS